MEKFKIKKTYKNSYDRPPEVTGGQKEIKFEKWTKEPTFSHTHSYDILDQLGLGNFYRKCH